MNFKKISATCAAVAVLAGSAFSGQLLTGGNIPLINNIVGIGLLTLDFSSPGDDATIARFIINNNSTSYDVAWSFANGAEFQNPAGVAIAMTALQLDPSGAGTPGAGITELANEDILAAAQGAGYTWDPADQTKATINYELLMLADWADPSDYLAGLYTETITFSITATM